MAKQTKTKKKFLVEVPMELVKKLQLEAERERRSRNAQIVRVLEERYQLMPVKQAA